LREDVALEMPPLLTWFTGRQAVTRFAASYLLTEPGRLRLVPVMANGQPSVAVYQREPGGAYHAHAVLVPTVTPTGIARIVAFQDPGLFGSFGLPREFRAAGLMPAQDPAVPPWPAEQGTGAAQISCELSGRQCRAGHCAAPGRDLTRSRAYAARQPGCWRLRRCRAGRAPGRHRGP